MAGGVTWVREDFGWASIEATRGVDDWTYTDKLMTSAATNGISVLAVVSSTPAWASSDPTSTHDKLYPPTNPADFAAFAAAVAARYGNTGTFWAAHPELPKKPLAAMEIWNEPWCRCAWKPDPDPPGYATLAKQTILAVRPVDPSIKLLISGEWYQSRSSGPPVPWVQTLLQGDKSLATLADGYDIHPYPGPRNLGPYEEPNLIWSFGRVKYIHDWLVAHSVGLPLWITEIGWSTGTNDDQGVSEDTQALYTGGAIERSLKDWGSFVPRIFIYSWERSGQSPGTRDYALRRGDNSGRPAWDAIVSLATGGGPVGPWDPDSPLAGGQGTYSDINDVDPDAAAQQQGGTTTSSGGGRVIGQTGDGIMIRTPTIRTVVLQPDELIPLNRGEARGKRFWTDLDIKRTQPSGYTIQTGVHLGARLRARVLHDRRHLLPLAVGQQAHPGRPDALLDPEPPAAPAAT